jgi:hypothetical protein
MIHTIKRTPFTVFHGESVISVRTNKAAKNDVGTETQPFQTWSSKRLITTPPPYVASEYGTYTYHTQDIGSARFHMQLKIDKDDDACFLQNK